MVLLPSNTTRMTDLEIARKSEISPIETISEKLGIGRDKLEPYGHYKAKLPLNLIDEERVKRAKLVLVSALSPTPAGEGKTTVSIGLNDGLNRIGKRSVAVLREPSLGPVFGIKGGATGGGHSQVLPMEDINLHFNGDFAAIEKANNLLAALIDNNIQNQKVSLGIDPRTVVWKRVMDMNDRALRNIIVGLGGSGNGIPRETGFDITAASEVMAILCLARDREDLKRRLGNIFVGYTFDKKPVYARDLKAEGAMAALLKDAIKPNLVQSLEANPVLLHGGPFANIAQGTNTITATKIGMSLSDYTVTEAGFGFDLGGEKFLNIKCREGGFSPAAIVMVATIRALKYHGGASLDHLTTPDPQAVEKGLPNLERHLENARKFGVEPIVAINRFATDSDDEVTVVKEACKQLKVRCVTADVWAEGGKGAEALAEAVADVAENEPAKFRPLYELGAPVKKKIEIIAKEIYGAGKVEFSAKAKADLRSIKKLGLEDLAICMAKTQKSFSDDPSKIGRPEGFTLNIREIEIAAGAGFLIPITGTMMRMPGLPAHPAAEGINIDDAGNISGLF